MNNRHEISPANPRQALEWNAAPVNLAPWQDFTRGDGVRLQSASIAPGEIYIDLTVGEAAPGTFLATVAISDDDEVLLLVHELTGPFDTAGSACTAAEQFAAAWLVFHAAESTL